MYPNMTRSFSESRQALAYLSSTDGISSVDAFLTQTVGALGMSLAHNKVEIGSSHFLCMNPLILSVYVWMLTIVDLLFVCFAIPKPIQVKRTRVFVVRLTQRPIFFSPGESEVWHQGRTKRAVGLP